MRTGKDPERLSSKYFSIVVFTTGKAISDQGISLSLYNETSSDSIPGENSKLESSALKKM